MTTFGLAGETESEEHVFEYDDRWQDTIQAQVAYLPTLPTNSDTDTDADTDNTGTVTVTASSSPMT
ncbi:hypothetical protein QIS74_10567 [Colletotrichum tabaci]|uniref:Uncharacterized protein n=1 Tax=Colletotrichum tabaci TaxID=1209068 RepID=A0AAV9T112_9PEZI